MLVKWFVTPHVPVSNHTHRPMISRLVQNMQELSLLSVLPVLGGMIALEVLVSGCVMFRWLR